MQDKDRNRFWNKVNKTDTCWLWKGVASNNSYGQISIAGQPYRAHRLSYEIHYGPIPRGLLVCHHCDTPACVRPDHLFLGSHSDNSQDMASKNRHGAIVKPETIRRGEGAACHILTEEDVLKIVELRNSGLTFKEVADVTQNPQGRVSSILNGESWIHITGIHKDRGAAQGINNGSSVLDEAKVLEIVVLHKSGLTLSAIAKTMGVGISTIHHIVKGRTWSWLTGIEKPQQSIIYR